MPRRAAALLDDLDELPYRDRMTALAARARALAAAGRLAGALADLRAGWLTADDLRPLLADAPAELDAGRAAR
ncbi:hypothetical protein [Micromonospora sp. NBC_01412]|uniref:hypothetical protein n=1 Tax=Micromonospora sp. NBC_01412 TaxID=2903590 RepID=UPI0032558F6F